MATFKSKVERLKSLIEGFSSGLMFGVVIMVVVIFQSLNLHVQRELATVLIATLAFSVITLISSIHIELSRKQE